MEVDMIGDLKRFLIVEIGALLPRYLPTFDITCTPSLV
jgi:hypothetical protein